MIRQLGPTGHAAAKGPLDAPAADPTDVDVLG